MNELINVVDNLSNMLHSGDNISPQRIMQEISKIENLLQAYEEENYEDQRKSEEYGLMTISLLQNGAINMAVRVFDAQFQVEEKEVRTYLDSQIIIHPE